MRAGELRQTITVSIPATWTTDSGGNQTVATWTDTTAYAKVEPMSAFERMASGVQEGETGHKVTIRYLSTVTPYCKITLGSRTLRITGVRNIDERNVTMVLECAERI